MLRNLKSLYRDEKGLTTVEWVVLAGMVAAVAIAGGVVVRGGVSSAAGVIANRMNNAIKNASAANGW